MTISPVTPLPRNASEATVMITSPLHANAHALAERLFARVIQEGKDGQGLSRAECLAQADGMVIRLGGLSATELKEEHTPRLRIVSRTGVGYDSIDPKAAKARNIGVTNLPGANSQAVAELALTLTLALLRRVKELDAALTSGEVVSSVHSLAPGLAGKTVGLVGMGNIALHFAMMLRAFGCRILVHSPTSSTSRWTNQDPDVAAIGGAIQHERVELEYLLRESDVVSLHCPLRPETHNLIGRKELGIMKSTAVLINTARGGVVDERALEAALAEGKLGGAGLDVWETEPVRGEYLKGLGKMRNVICLPHVGASTLGVAEATTIKAVEIVANFFDTGEIENRVI